MTRVFVGQSRPILLVLAAFRLLAWDEILLAWQVIFTYKGPKMSEKEAN